MAQKLTESQLKQMIHEAVLKELNENETDEWFDNIRAAGRGIKNRVNNAVQTAKGVYGAVKNGDMNGIARELQNGVQRGIEHRAANIGQYVGDKVQNVKDVWNGAKQVGSAIKNGLARGYQNGVNRNQPQATAAGATGLAQAGAAGAQAAQGAAATTKQKPKAQPNQRVQQLQKALRAAGYNTGNIDGLMGPKTMAAAKQAGINPQTWQPGTAITPNPASPQQLKPNLAAAAPVDSANVIQNMKLQPQQVAESQLVDMLASAIMEQLDGKQSIDEGMIDTAKQVANGIKKGVTKTAKAIKQKVQNAKEKFDKAPEDAKKAAREIADTQKYF